MTENKKENDKNKKHEKGKNEVQPFYHKLAVGPSVARGIF